MNIPAQTPHSIPQPLYDLAPTDLIVYRQERYDGGGLSVTLKDLAPEDVSLVIQVYNSVRRLYDLWLYMTDAPNYTMLKQYIVNQFGSDNFLTAAQALGSATYALGKDKPQMRKVMHDVRGSALVVLTGYAHMMKLKDLDEVTIEDVQNGVLTARDHAKLMRNAIEDLDPMVREADESIKVHYIDDFVNKWTDTQLNIAGKRVDINVTCTFTGSVTNRCLETSAIDRVLYNYINNAARFTADNIVNLTIFPLGDQAVRWVIDNQITSKQQEWLAKTTGSDLSKLFKGGLTRGGHGLGLSNCLDFVSNSFGVENEEALTHGYLGAKIIDDRYYAWFHWPSYTVSEDDVICQCGD